MRLTIQSMDVQTADIATRVDMREDRFLTIANVCPAAQALCRLGYEQVYVGANYATVKRGDWRGRFAIPLLLTEQIESWDAGLGFVPGDFDLIPVKMPDLNTLLRERVRPCR